MLLQAASVVARSSRAICVIVSFPCARELNQRKQWLSRNTLIKRRKIADFHRSIIRKRQEGRNNYTYAIEVRVFTFKI